MMNRRLMLGLTGLSLALVAAPGASLAGGPHLESAIVETREAIAAGQQSQSASFVEHAVKAVAHAHAAQAADPDSAHIKAGITHLTKAIRLAKGSHSRRRVAVAVQGALAALGNFEYANMWP